MKVNAVSLNKISQYKNNGKVSATFGNTYYNNAENQKREDFRVSRLRAIVTGMVITAIALFLGVGWFWLTKGKPNKHAKV